MLKTCVPLSKTDLAELLSAAAWSENVFPEHSAVEWGDVQLPQLPSVFYSLLFFASSYSSSTSGGGLRRCQNGFLEGSELRLMAR